MAEERWKQKAATWRGELRDKRATNPLTIKTELSSKYFFLAIKALIYNTPPSPPPSLTVPYTTSSSMATPARVHFAGVCLLLNCALKT